MNNLSFNLIFILILAFLCTVVAAGDTDTLQLQLNQEQSVSLPSLNDGTTWRNETKLNPVRLTIVTGALVAAEIAGMTYLNNVWYTIPKGKFHVKNFELDMKAWQQMDKWGHLVHAFYATDLMGKAYRWSGFSVHSSIWLSSITAWIWMLQIEVKDGFFVDWGFSWGDFAANSLGVTFAALRQMYPDELGGFRFKVSYHESPAYRLGYYTYKNISNLDDYEGLTFWVTANIYDVLPANIQRDYPDWLKPFGIAIGQSARGVANHVHGGVRQVYLSLDIDITKISFGGFDRFALVRFLKDQFNYIKLPLPTILISPETTYVGFHF